MACGAMLADIMITPDSSSSQPTARFSLVDEYARTFTWPFGWLQGVGLNVLLAAIYLLVRPLAADDHYDVVTLFTVYFANFIMADVTTTNIFGHDFLRAQAASSNRSQFAQLLRNKNIVQAVVIMMPMTVITVVITWVVNGPAEVMLAIPAVLYPMLLWLGVGNILSVLYPVPAVGVKRRCAHYRQWRWHVPVFISYAIPWLLYTLFALTDAPGQLNALIRWCCGNPHPWESALALLVVSVFIFIVLNRISLRLATRRGLVLRHHDAMIAGEQKEEKSVW